MQARDLSFFVSLLTVLDETAEALGLSNLSESDKVILQAMWLAASGNKGIEFRFSHSKLNRVLKERGLSFSRAQFYKTVNLLEQNGVVIKSGGQRSSLYIFR